MTDPRRDVAERLAKKVRDRIVDMMMMPSPVQKTALAAIEVDLRDELAALLRPVHRSTEGLAELETLAARLRNHRHPLKECPPGCDCLNCDADRAATLLLRSEPSEGLKLSDIAPTSSAPGEPSEGRHSEQKRIEDGPLPPQGEASEGREPDAWVDASVADDLREGFYRTRSALLHRNLNPYGSEKVPVHFGTPSDSPTGERELRQLLGAALERLSKYEDTFDLRASDSPEREGPHLADFPEDDDVTDFFAAAREVARWLHKHGLTTRTAVERITAAEPAESEGGVHIVRPRSEHGKPLDSDLAQAIEGAREHVMEAEGAAPSPEGVEATRFLCGVCYDAPATVQCYSCQTVFCGDGDCGYAGQSIACCGPCCEETAKAYDQTYQGQVATRTTEPELDWLKSLHSDVIAAEQTDADPPDAYIEGATVMFQAVRKRLESRGCRP